MLLFMNRRLTGMLCLFLGAVFLIAGWWPFAPFPRNRVSWLTDRHGLDFQRPGMVYDPEPLPTPTVKPSGNSNPGFTVELSLEPALEPSSDVFYILTIDD